MQVTSLTETAQLARYCSCLPLGRRDRHQRANLREDRANTTGNPRHDGACGYGQKARHESAVDEILTVDFPQRS